MRFINTYTVILVDRKYLFRDAFNGIMNKSSKELKRKLKIEYKKEKGIDGVDY